MDTCGKHLLVEYWGCGRQVLDDQGEVQALMERAARAAGATIVATTFHRFAPHGVSGVVVVEESHLSIHTWPERGYAAVDFYTCGSCRPERAHQVIESALKPKRVERMMVHRGLRPSSPSMVLETHVNERSEAGHDQPTAAEEADADPFKRLAAAV